MSNTNPFFTELNKTIVRAISHPTSDDLRACAIVELARRAEKGCRNPQTQVWLEQVLEAAGEGTPIPRKATALKRVAKPAPVAPKVDRKVLVKSTKAKFASLADSMSNADLELILGMESADSLATTFRAVA